MKVGISTACFYPHPLEEAVDAIASLGLTCIEVFINTESEFSPAFVRSLRERTDAAGIEVVSVHPFTSPMEGLLLFSSYPRRTQDAFAQHRRYFEAAQILGARYFTFHGERPFMQTRGEAEWEAMYRTCSTFCDIASEYGVTVAQENVAWCRSSDPAYLKRLHDNVPELGFTLDIKQARRAEHPYEEYLDVIGDRLVNVHINDYSREETCLLPGEGVLDYAAFLKRLQACDYDGQLLIEVYQRNFTSLEQVQRAAHSLCKACRKAGIALKNDRK